MDNSPIDFRHDECNRLLDVRDLLKFFEETGPKGKRSKHFNIHYVLYYLLKRRDYSVTPKDFPEITGFTATKKLCVDFYKLQVFVHENPSSNHS